MSQFIIELCNYPEQKALKVFKVTERDNQTFFELRTFDGEEYYGNFSEEYIDDFAKQLQDNVALTTQDGCLLLSYEDSDKGLLNRIAKGLNTGLADVGPIKVPVNVSSISINKFLTEFSSYVKKGTAIVDYNKETQELILKNGDKICSVLQGQARVVVKTMPKQKPIKSLISDKPSIELPKNEQKQQKVLVASDSANKSVENSNQSVTMVPIPKNENIEPKQSQENKRERASNEEFKAFISDEASGYTEITDYRK